jgi:general secretion pathway protein F
MRFRVTAVGADLAIERIAVDAVDEGDARQQAAQRGLRVLSVARDRARLGGRARFPLLHFSQELIALLGAGLTLTEAIDALAEKETQPSTRAILGTLQQRLGEGRSLSAAAAEMPLVFPALYVATLKASERTGAIAEALARYVRYQEQIDSLRKRVTSAAIYPCVLLVAGALVTLFLVAYVVPRFSGIYADVGRDLPWASRMLMNWGRLLDEHGAAVAVVAAGVLAGAAVLLSRPEVRAFVGRSLASIPSLGRQLHLYQLARFYRTVGMLLRGGTPVVTAFEMSQGLLGAALQGGLALATRDVRAGRGLPEALAAHGLTTPVADRMLRVGVKSGEMGEMMERIASFYDEELARFVDVATRLIEPAMMTVIGLVIGTVVVLMYFPIFELAGSVQ